MEKIESSTRVLLVGPGVAPLRQLFEARGVLVTSAGAGLEGIARLGASNFDVVILELALGDLAATEFLTAARQEHPRTTFLMLDDPSQADAIVRALQVGLDGFVPTPLAEDQLFAEVARHRARTAATHPAGFAEESATHAGVTRVGDAGFGALTREAVAALRAVDAGAAAHAARPPDGEDAAGRLAAVARAFDGLIDGPLTEEVAQELRARLQIAQINDVERGTLLGELDHLRVARRTLGDELETARRALATSRAQGERAGELAAALALAEERLLALQNELGAARDALAVATVDKVVAADRAGAEEEMRARLEQELAAAERRLVAERIERAEADTRERAARADERAQLAADLERVREETEAAHAALLRARAEANERVHAEASRAREAARDEARVELEAALGRAVEQHETALAATKADEAAAVVVAVTRARDEHKAGLRAAIDDAVAQTRREAEAAQRAAVEEARSRARAEHAASERKAVDEALARARAAEHMARQSALDEVATRAATEHAAAQQAAVAAAVAAARAEHAAAQRSAVNAAVARLRAEVDHARRRDEAARTALAVDRQRAVDRATDVELQLEEARVRIDFINEEASRVRDEADERVRRVELEFKRERLRLIDEKQQAASGSQEAALKLQGYIDDNQALRARVVTLEGEREDLVRGLREAVDRSDATVRELRRSHDELAAATARHEDIAQAQTLTQATLGAVQAHARALEEKLASADVELRAARAERELERQARGVADDALRARENAATVAEEAHRRAWSERDVQVAAERARLEAELRADRAHVERLDAQHAAATAAATAAQAAAQQERDDGAQALAQAQREHERVVAELAAARRSLDEERASASAARAALDDRQVALVASRLEEQRLRAAADAAVDAGQRDRADAQRAHGRIEELTAEFERLRQAALGAEPGSDTPDVAADRIATLEQQNESLRAAFAAHDAAAQMTTRSLIDGLEPLRPGLAAALDYVEAFEQRDPAVGAHLRTLRLLAATVGRLLAARRSASDT